MKHIRLKKMVKKQTKGANTQTKANPSAPLEAYERTVGLQRWLAALYAAQALILLVAGSAFSVTITATFLTRNSLQSSDAAVVLSPAMQRITDVDLLYIVAAMLFVLALASLLATTVYKEKYLRSLEQNTYVFRTLTIGIGVVGTVLVLALLSGFRDAVALLAILVLMKTALVCLHLYQQRTARRLTQALGWLAVGTVFVSFLSVPFFSWLYNGTFPAYLYGVYAVFAAYVALTIVLVARSLGRDDQTGRLLTERSLAIALIGVQSLIVWQLFLGVFN